MFDFEAIGRKIAALREKRLFFIGGAVKSGTTWLQLLLDRHPDICCRGEGHFANALIPALVNAIDDYNQQVAWKSETVFSELPSYPVMPVDDMTYLWVAAVSLMLHLQCAGSTASVIGEKTPDNVRAFGVLSVGFPEAKFIQIVRDGRDAAVSNWFHNLRISPERTAERWASLDAFCEVFADNWSSELAAGSEFGVAFPDRYAVIRYEDLYRDTESTLASLFEFLEVPVTSAILACCREEGSFERLSGGRASGEEDRSSFFRKGQPGDWRCHLSAAAEARFRKVAGTWMRRFGYS